MAKVPKKVDPIPDSESPRITKVLIDIWQSLKHLASIDHSLKQIAEQMEINNKLKIKEMTDRREHLQKKGVWIHD